MRSERSWRGWAALVVGAGLVGMASPALAADVAELFEESLGTGKIDYAILGTSQLDETLCWGQVPKSDELVCVLYERDGEASTWTLVAYNPLRGEVERHVIATLSKDFGDTAPGAGLKAANAAMKKRKWRSIEAKLEVSGPAAKPEEVALTKGHTLRAEGNTVRLIEGSEVVAQLDVSVTSPPTDWTFYELVGGVAVVETTRTKTRQTARVWTFTRASTKAAGVEDKPSEGSPATACASCPASFAELSPLMGKLCEGTFWQAELSALKGHVAAGRLDKDEVARLWNTVGAMTGFVFKKYPHWNALFTGADQGALPAPCRPWMQKAHKEGELPKGVRAGRDLIRNYWKTL